MAKVALLLALGILAAASFVATRPEDATRPGFDLLVTHYVLKAVFYSLGMTGRASGMRLVLNALNGSIGAVLNAEDEGVVHSDIALSGSHINIRVFSPRSALTEKENLPLVVYFHGGGWTLGGHVYVAALASRLAKRANVHVASVEYGLAPEHRFPTAYDDAFAAVQHLHGAAAALFRGDPSRMVLAGDSAGGNLAAAVAQRMRDEGMRQALGQVLIYPVVDASYPATPSMRTYADGYIINRPYIEFFLDQYLGVTGDAAKSIVEKDVRLSPILADSFEDLPPALVVLAKHDVLHDQGVEYAGRLSAANVPVKLRRYDTVHGFIVTLEGEGEKATDDIAAQIRQWVADSR